MIPQYLEGDMKKVALNFVAFMRANKMQPVWQSTNTWKANYKGKCICYVRLKTAGKISDRCSWSIQPYTNHMPEYEETIINEKLQNTVWDNLNYCYGCHSAPCRQKEITIFEKQAKCICNGTFATLFFDPDEVIINVIKKLLELEQQARNEK